MYILASGSPRRKELLSLIIPEFEILVSGCEESVPENTPAEKVPAILAEQKALSVSKIRPDDIVIGSDTVVVQKLKKLVKVTVALGLQKSKADRH